MEFASDPIFQWLAQFAYEPMMVYGLFMLMMLASSVGVPIPEEVSIISLGVIVFMGSHPDHFPPPYEGAPVVKMHTAAFFAFFAVVFSDFNIYLVGRFFGRKFLYHPRVKKMISLEMMERVENWTLKYGAYACGLFRFTPGLRFPGHLASGMLKFPAWKFLAIDGTAALLSVPTQVYLVAIYGEAILSKLKQGKFIVFSVLGCVLLFVLIRKWLRSRQQQA